MSVNERYDIESSAERHVYDDNFEPLSQHVDDQGRLGSIDLLIRRNGKSYVVSVVSYPLHVERMAFEEADELEPAENDAYVLSAEYILPTDLLTIKNMPLEELQPYLVEQEISD